MSEVTVQFVEMIRWHYAQLNKSRIEKRRCEQCGNETQHKYQRSGHFHTYTCTICFNYSAHWNKGTSDALQ